MNTNLTCSTCGALNEVAAEDAGTQFACYQCGAELQLAPAVHATLAGPTVRRHKPLSLWTGPPRPKHCLRCGARGSLNSITDDNRWLCDDCGAYVADSEYNPQPGARVDVEHGSGWLEVALTILFGLFLLFIPFVGWVAYVVLVIRSIWLACKTKCRCSVCRNPVAARDVRVCPTCHAQLS